LEFGDIELRVIFWRQDAENISNRAPRIIIGDMAMRILFDNRALRVFEGRALRIIFGYRALRIFGNMALRIIFGDRALSSIFGVRSLIIF
jgi:hypothetical protein